jgi:hypothetical protein
VLAVVLLALGALLLTYWAAKYTTYVECNGRDRALFNELLETADMETHPKLHMRIREAAMQMEMRPMYDGWNHVLAYLGLGVACMVAGALALTGSLTRKAADVPTHDTTKSESTTDSTDRSQTSSGQSVDEWEE